MYYIELVIEHRRFAEEQILHILLQSQVLDTAEPNKFDGILSIGENGNQALVFTLSNGTPIGDRAYDLHIGVVVFYLANFPEPAPVDIFIGKDIEEVEGSLHLECLLKHRSTLKPYTLKISNILMCKFHDRKLLNNKGDLVVRSPLYG